MLHLKLVPDALHNDLNSSGDVWHELASYHTNEPTIALGVWLAGWLARCFCGREALWVRLPEGMNNHHVELKRPSTYAHFFAVGLDVQLIWSEWWKNNVCR